MKGFLEAMQYGNAKVSGSHPFWIAGDLRISPDEQIQFLRKLRARDLPFTREHINTIIGLIRLDYGEGWTLFGKTGWAQPDGLNVGWFVGWVEAQESTYFFATNIQSEDSEDFGEARKRISLAALRKIGAIPAE